MPIVLPFAELGKWGCLFCNALILGLLLWWACAAERYLYNCWMGPVAITPQSIEKITNPDTLRRPHVSLSHLPTRRRGCETSRFIATNIRKQRQAAR